MLHSQLVHIMELLSLRVQSLFRNRNQRCLFLVIAVAVTHLMFQSLMLPYENALLSLLPNKKDLVDNNGERIMVLQSSTKAVTIRNPLTVNVSELPQVSSSRAFNVIKDTMGGNSSSLHEGLELTVQMEIEDAKDQVAEEHPLVNLNEKHVLDMDSDFASEEGETVVGDIMLEQTVVKNESFSSHGSDISSIGWLNALKSPQNIVKNESLIVKKKYRCDIPPNSVTTIQEMEQIYVRNRAKSRSMV